MLSATIAHHIQSPTPGPSGTHNSPADFNSNSSEIDEYGDPIPDDLTGHVDTWVETYTQGRSRDEGLWVNFGESFGRWSAQTFGLLSSDTRNKLRDAFRENSVYVERGKRTIIERALAKTTQKKE